MALDATQKEKLAALLAQEHVPCSSPRVRSGRPPTCRRLPKRRNSTCCSSWAGMSTNIRTCSSIPRRRWLVDNRDVGKVPSFEIVRAWMQGIASDVARWERGVGIAQGDFPQEEPVRGAVFQKRRTQNDSHQAHAGLIRERPARHLQSGTLAVVYNVLVKTLYQVMRELSGRPVAAAVRRPVPQLADVALLFLDLLLQLELRLLRFIGRSAGGLGGIARGRDGVVDLAIRERDVIGRALLQARALRQQVRDFGLLRWRAGS